MSTNRAGCSFNPLARYSALPSRQHLHGGICFLDAKISACFASVPVDSDLVRHDLFAQQVKEDQVEHMHQVSPYLDIVLANQFNARAKLTHFFVRDAHREADLKSYTTNALRF